MKRYSLSHLADHVLLRALHTIVGRDRETTAEMLAHIAEVDSRKLYLPAAYPSMYAYCVGELRLSEDAAFKRIRAARTARKSPAIFPALADGSLNLSSVLMLTPHLAPETADELLAVAAHKTNAQLEVLLAERFPQPDLASLVQATAPAVIRNQLAVRPAAAEAGQHAPQQVASSADRLAARPVEQVSPRSKVTPLAPRRFALQFSIGQEAHDELRYVQALLGHAVPSGDLEQAFGRAMKALVRELERCKVAATSRTRPGRGSTNARHVPVAVKREVWVRDGGRCTFVGDRGKRCEARTRLEFDHVAPVARGGRATVKGMRLLCRGHNQHAAECAFGKGFMFEKRQEARHQGMEARKHGTAAAQSAKPAQARATSEILSAAAQEVIPWLRQLGFRADEASKAAALCEAIPDAPLEERLRHALKSLCPPGAHRPMHVAGSPA